MLTNFTKDDGTNLIFTGYCLEIYVPMRYFESGISKWEGEVINTFGLIYAAVLDNKMNRTDVEIINLPTWIYLYPKDTEIKELKLISESPYPPEKYQVLKFFKGDAFMPSSIHRESDYAQSFVGMMCGGKIGPNIPYDKILDVWLKNLEINNVNLGVSSSILEIIISEIYRDYDNPELRFADVLAKEPKKSKYRYKTANIREICSRNSTFAALTFEDMDAMITTSLNMKNYNKKQTESPLEKLMKM